jgi:hypothetical protein
MKRNMGSAFGIKVNGNVYQHRDFCKKETPFVSHCDSKGFPIKQTLKQALGRVGFVYSIVFHVSLSVLRYAVGPFICCSTEILTAIMLMKSTKVNIITVNCINELGFPRI